MAGGVDFNAKDLFNAVNGNKDLFIQRYVEKNKTSSTEIAEKMFNFYAGMNTDESPEISDEEYVQGLLDRKALKEIQRDNILSKYVATEDLDFFNSLSPVGKQDYIAEQLPINKDDKNAVMANRIKATQILTELNRHEAEIKLLSIELRQINNEEELEKNKALVDMLRPYLADDDRIVEFLKLPEDERVGFLKSHLSHTPGTSDEELEKSAKALMSELAIIEDIIIERNEQKHAMEAVMLEDDLRMILQDNPYYDEKLELTPQEKEEYFRRNAERDRLKQAEVDSLIDETRNRFFGE